MPLPKDDGKSFGTDERPIGGGPNPPNPDLYQIEKNAEQGTQSDRGAKPDMPPAPAKDKGYND